MKRQNSVSAHLRTNLPRDHSAAQTYSATAAFLRVRKVRSGLTNPQREKQIRTTGYAIEGITQASGRYRSR